MKFVGPFFRWGVALAFFGDNVNQHRAVFPFGCSQHGQKVLDVMAVHRPEVLNTQMLKHGLRGYQIFDPALHPFDNFQHIVTVLHIPQPVFHITLQLIVGLPGAQLIQVLGHGSHVFGDGHLVIVKDDDEPSLGIPDMVEGFEGHTACHGAVADDSHHLKVLAFQVTGRRNAIRRRKGRGRVTHTEGVVLAFLPFGEAGKTFVLAQGGKGCFSSC